MKEWFVKFSYPEAVTEKEMKKICFYKQGKTCKKVEKGVPFVVTYHPLLNKLTSIIYRNFYMLYINQEVKNFFTLGPIVPFKNARKISSYLVRAQLYPLERKVASEKFGVKLLRTATGKRFKINHKLKCEDNSLIYLLTCRCCGKQYVGETIDEYPLRWNSYKSNDWKNARNETCMQGNLFEHFKSESHSGLLGNVSITLIDKTDGKDPKKKKN